MYGIEPDLIRSFDNDLLNFLASNFIFKTKEYDEFFLILNNYFEYMMEDFGADRIQLSKKERVVFLGVKIYNEVILDDNLSYQQKLQYHFDRINEVKEKNLSRLVKNGLVVLSKR